MGTSQSKRDARPGASLVPPWADRDPEAADTDADSGEDNAELTPDVSSAPTAAPRRYAAFRTAFGRFASSADMGDARRALGHWVRTSRGGSANATKSISRAISSGSAVLAALSRAVVGAPSEDGETLSLSSLAGLPSDVAIWRIVDAFCPPGILDEELARLAIDEALAKALGSADTFDPTALDANALRIATLTFVSELVFVAVMGDAGRALSAAPTIAAAAQREADIRTLVREVADLVGTPTLADVGFVLTSTGMDNLVTKLVAEVQEEMSRW